MRTEAEEAEIEKSAAPLVEHLIELRSRLIWSVGAFFVAFLVSFFFAVPLFNILTKPYQWAASWAELPDQHVQFIYTAPQEFFFTQLKIGMFGGFILAFPMIATQLYRFIAPGLYSNERKAFYPFLIATPILFGIGAALVYFLVMPMAMWFFLSMEQAGGEGMASIQHLPKVSEYLGLIMTLIIAFGLVFQMPIAITLMATAGLVSADGLADKRKYAIVIAFVVAAILTPPDPLSQIGLAIPTVLLYEVSILAARWVERQRAAAAKAGAEKAVSDGAGTAST